MNSQIMSESVPTINTIKFEMLPKKARKKSIYSSSIFSIIIGLPVGFSFLFSPHIAVDISLSFIFILLALNIFHSMKSYHYKFYAIREKDLLYRSGMFFRQTVVVPFNRIQHVEMKQTPLDRKFDLAKLVFFTAGGSASDLKISGLYKEDAEKIRMYIIEKIGDLSEH